MAALIGKVILLGDAKVGKTSILSRYTEGIFREEYSATIGANFVIKEIDLTKILDKLNAIDREKKSFVRDQGLKLYFWDIGGQSDKLFVTEYYFLQAVGAMIVFNIANSKSFENLGFWISKLKDLSGEIPFVVIGNKSDLSNERAVEDQDILEKMEEFKASYYETSAKLNENINKPFEDLSILILNNFKLH